MIANKMADVSKAECKDDAEFGQGAQDGGGGFGDEEEEGVAVGDSIDGLSWAAGMKGFCNRQ